MASPPSQPNGPAKGTGRDQGPDSSIAPGEFDPDMIRRGTDRPKPAMAEHKRQLRVVGDQLTLVNPKGRNLAVDHAALPKQTRLTHSHVVHSLRGVESHLNKRGRHFGASPPSSEAIERPVAESRDAEGVRLSPLLLRRHSNRPCLLTGDGNQSLGRPETVSLFTQPS
jgi:hypothetical protein